MALNDRQDYVLRDACSKAIATRLANKANEFVTEEMIETRRQLEQLQLRFRNMVMDAADTMVHGKF